MDLDQLTETETPAEDFQQALAALASEGNIDACNQLNVMITPLINEQNRRFCQRFCGQNNRRYQCSLLGAEESVNNEQSSATVCEWGKAGYLWMLAALTDRQQLLQYEQRHQDTLADYFFQHINSLNFYQQWKNWRFSTTQPLPAFIQQMGPDSAKLFQLLKTGRRTTFIAQNLSLPETEISVKIQQLIQELVNRQKLFLLDSADSSYPSVNNIDDLAGKKVENNPKQTLLQAWEPLTPVEQFIVQALLVENQSAEDVLYALKTLDIRIKEGVLPEDCNPQQLTGFKLAVLKKLAGFDNRAGMTAETDVQACHHQSCKQQGHLDIEKLVYYTSHPYEKMDEIFCRHLAECAECRQLFITVTRLQQYSNMIIEQSISRDQHNLIIDYIHNRLDDVSRTPARQKIITDAAMCKAALHYSSHSTAMRRGLKPQKITPVITDAHLSDNNWSWLQSVFRLWRVPTWRRHVFSYIEKYFNALTAFKLAAWRTLVAGGIVVIVLFLFIALAY